LSADVAREQKGGSEKALTFLISPDGYSTYSFMEPNIPQIVL
jgi:hypothetical protein